MRTKRKTGSVPAAAQKNVQAARISLFVSKELRDLIQAVAQSERRTLNKQCELLLERGLQAEGKALAAAA